MDRGICNGCRSSRISTVCAVVVVSLILASVKVSSVKLDEQSCKPRPVVVDETKGHKPYHILLHRCSGTCDGNISPKHKPCRAKSSTKISLEATDPSSGKPITIKVDNHTSCSCDCDLDCKWHEGELANEKDCTCVPGIDQPNPGERRDDSKTVNVLPYKIGLASMGLVTLCVVVFEIIMCAKRKEVLEKVKESCCKKEDHTDDKERKSNGSLNTAV